MDKKNTKPAKAVEKSVPQKPARKKRRIVLWLFLFLFLLGGLVGAGFYYRLIPLDEETAAKVEPYIVKAEDIARSTGETIASVDWEKLKVWKSSEEEIANGKPKTNFPLVELNDSPKPTVPTGSTTTASSVLGSPAVAAAAPAQPAAGGGKPATVTATATDTAKVYSKLSKLYGSMKPEEAAAIFNNLEDEQAIMILARMEEEAAGKVLATMEPKRAARLTQAMIKRK